MHCLLDTHTLIWFLENDKRLSKKAKKTIESQDNIPFISIVSLWEIAIKLNLGKLEISVTIDDIIDEANKMGIAILPITVEAVKLVQFMPLHHRDPFDRLLIAQAEANGLTIITDDSMFDNYTIQTVW
jgi:PIN domain nuclease of toxin-antitoxin system